MHRISKMFLVVVAALGIDSLAVAAIVGALALERTWDAHGDAVFDTTLGIAILFVTVAWLVALVANGWHRHDNDPHPPNFLA